MKWMVEEENTLGKLCIIPIIWKSIQLNASPHIEAQPYLLQPQRIPTPRFQLTSTSVWRWRTTTIASAAASQPAINPIPTDNNIYILFFSG